MSFLSVAKCEFKCHAFLTTFFVLVSVCFTVSQKCPFLLPYFITMGVVP